MLQLWGCPNWRTVYFDVRQKTEWIDASFSTDFTKEDDFFYLECMKVCMYICLRFFHQPFNGSEKSLCYTIFLVNQRRSGDKLHAGLHFFKYIAWNFFKIHYWYTIMQQSKVQYVRLAISALFLFYIIWLPVAQWSTRQHSQNSYILK